MLRKTSATHPPKAVNSRRGAPRRDQTRFDELVVQLKTRMAFTQTAGRTHATDVDGNAPLFGTRLRSQHNRIVRACAWRSVPASGNVGRTKVTRDGDSSLLCDNTEVTKLPVRVSRDCLAVAPDELDAASIDPAARTHPRQDLAEADWEAF